MAAAVSAAGGGQAGAAEGDAIHEAEHAASAGRDVRHGRGPQAALARHRDHALVDLNGHEARIERIALRGDGGKTLVEVATAR